MCTSSRADIALNKSIVRLINDQNFKARDTHKPKKNCYMQTKREMCNKFKWSLDSFATEYTINYCRYFYGIESAFETIMQTNFS